jgi:two-component system cell cycle response regulator
MRFHKSESAFFIFMLVILMASGLVLFAYDGLQEAGAAIGLGAGADVVAELKRLLFATSILNAVAVFFGLFFVFPLLRIHVKEEGKLRAMAKTLSARSQTLEQAALTDPLTGMHNRRYFDDALKEYLCEFAKIHKPVGLMIFDLDHFKHVNDTHGHDVGDEVLRAVAGCLRDMTRYHDVVARLGGEEFAVVAPNMDIDDLTKLAERIRQGIATMPISTHNVRLRITSSVGLAVWNRRENAESLFRRADQNLYQAKKEGRNRVSA